MCAEDKAAGRPITEEEVLEEVCNEHDADLGASRGAGARRKRKEGEIAVVGLHRYVDTTVIDGDDGGIEDREDGFAVCRS